MSTYFNEVTKLLIQDEDVDIHVKLYLENEFTRAFILRHLFCHVSLQCFMEHNCEDAILETSNNYLPASYPLLNCLSHRESPEVTLLEKALRYIVERIDVNTRQFFKED